MFDFLAQTILPHTVSRLDPNVTMIDLTVPDEDLPMILPPINMGTRPYKRQKLQHQNATASISTFVPSDTTHDYHRKTPPVPVAVAARGGNTLTNVLAMTMGASKQSTTAATVARYEETRYYCNCTYIVI